MAAPTRDEVLAQLTAPGSPFSVGEAEVLGVRMRVFTEAQPTMRAVL